MSFHLVVVEPFGGYYKGDHITNEAEIEQVLASENAGHVVKVAA